MKKTQVPTRYDHRKHMVDLIRMNSRRHPVHRVFADFVELAAITISNAVDRRQFELREARYLEIIRRYDRDEACRFAEMLAHLAMALGDDMEDVLGEIFMTLELTSQWKGQFFTPTPICQLMAQLTLGSISQQEINACGGFITVNEPTAGAGGMVIAVAESMAQAGLSYQQCLHATAQDVDSIAVHMTYLQCSLLDIPAVIVLGNSLQVETREVWFTPAHVLGGWSRRLQTRSLATASNTGA